MSIVALAIAFTGCAKEPKGSQIGESDVNGSGGGAGGAGTTLFGGSGGAMTTGTGATAGNGTGATTGGDAATGTPDSGEPQLSACDSIVGLSGCGAQTVGAKVRHPHMLIVLDKSKSTEDLLPGTQTSIWSGMKTALSSALDATKASVAFGLELYPYQSDPNVPIPADCQDKCCQMPTTPDMTVPIEDGTTGVPKILAALDATAPSGGTPTAVALQRAYDYYTSGPGSTLDGEKYVMLATDGGPNCNAALTCQAASCTVNLEGNCSAGRNCCDGYGEACVDDQAVITQINALAGAGIKTFVVGIPGSEAYSSYLDQFAVAGGVPNTSGTESYYRVDAAAGVQGLTDVFSAITTQLVTSCELQLEEAPPDPLKVNVAIDCEVVPHDGTDGTDGWVLDINSVPSKITLQGTLCRWVEHTGAQRVDIVFGCPTVQ